MQTQKDTIVSWIKPGDFICLQGSVIFAFNSSGGLHTILHDVSTTALVVATKVNFVLIYLDHKCFWVSEQVCMPIV